VLRHEHDQAAPLLDEFATAVCDSDDGPTLHQAIARLGAGITAWTYEDALWILEQAIFPETPLPKIERVVEDVDVSTITFRAGMSRIAPPSWRGIWYLAYLADWHHFRPRWPLGPSALGSARQ
jgi:hypothetical protein